MPSILTFLSAKCGRARCKSQYFKTKLHTVEFIVVCSWRDFEYQNQHNLFNRFIFIVFLTINSKYDETLHTASDKS